MTRFETLLAAYLDGTLDAEEVREFQSLLPYHQQELKARLHADLQKGRFSGMTDETQRTAMFEELMRKASLTAKPPLLVYLRRRWVSVAALIGLVLATGWFWVAYQGSGHHKSATRSAEIAARPDSIRPGGNKAILTLADGRIITLDSSGNGILARNGNSLIRKMADGRLVCTPTGNTSAEITYNTIATPNGGTYRITLPDGSNVWLNAVSSLRFPNAFAPGSREVEITGEAYFEIAPAPRSPFRVKLNTINIEVLGTSFNVNAYTDEAATRVTLLTGAIRLNKEQRYEQGFIKEQGQISSLILRPGQQVSLPENGLITVTNADTTEAVAWKNNTFYFNRAELAAVMRQISRWYDVDVSYTGEVSKKHFTGIINRYEDISEVLKLLELTGIKFQISGRKITVTP